MTAAKGRSREQMFGWFFAESLGEGSRSKSFEGGLHGGPDPSQARLCLIAFADSATSSDTGQDALRPMAECETCGEHGAGGFTPGLDFSLTVTE